MRFAFPGLAGDDAVRRPDGARNDGDERSQPGGIGGGAARQGLEGQHDERVAGQHGDRLAEFGVHRRLAAANLGIVEAGQVVVHQRSAMQQLDRGGGGVSRRGIRVAAGFRDRET